MQATPFACNRWAYCQRVDFWEVCVHLCYGSVPVTWYFSSVEKVLILWTPVYRSTSWIEEVGDDGKQGCYLCQAVA